MANQMSLLTSLMQTMNSQGANIPNGMLNSDQIISYLLQNGKITQQQYNQARAQVQRMESSGMIPPCPY